MKVLLINPLSTSSFITPPLGLLYLAASLKKAGHEPEILDLMLEKLGPEEVLAKISLEVRVIGIPAVTPLIQSAVSLANLIRKRFPEKIIILGGSHPSLLPEETLANSPCVDFIIKGEGEERINLLIGYLDGRRKEEELDGIVFRKNGKIIDLPVKKYVTNLDELPFPARELISVKKYSDFLESRQKPATTMITSRGCPFNCIYCSKPIFGNVCRLRSPENVLAEIEQLKEKYGIKEIIFYDDTFTLNRERVLKICNLLIDKKMDIKWKCETRVNLIDEELLGKMKEAGCYLVAFGVESGNQRILNILKKGITLEQVKKAVESAKKVGIETLGYFMIGVPGETEKEIDETIDFAKDLDLDFAQFSIATAFPGTELYQIARSQNKLPKDWSNSFYALGKEPNVSLCGVSIEKLSEYSKKAYRSFYLRPNFIFKKIKKIKSFGDLTFYFQGLKNLFGIFKN